VSGDIKQYDKYHIVGKIDNLEMLQHHVGAFVFIFGATTLQLVMASSFTRFLDRTQ
jgi:hypothetical protein